MSYDDWLEHYSDKYFGVNYESSNPQMENWLKSLDDEELFKEYIKELETMDKIKASYDEKGLLYDNWMLLPNYAAIEMLARGLNLATGKKVSDGLENEAKDNDLEREYKLKPGSGTIGPKGTALLIDYEDLGEDYKVYENDKLTAILSRDVEGKGNITYGYGILFKNTPEDRKRLKDTYGLEFRERVEVSIELCEQMYWDYVNRNLKGLHNFTRDNEISLNQNQMDALIMHRHLTGSLGEKTQDLLKEMFVDNDMSNASLKELYWDRLLEAMLEDLKDATDHAYFEKYKQGWTNRILDELELFFDGDAKRSY